MLMIKFNQFWNSFIMMQRVLQKKINVLAKMIIQFDSQNMYTG